MTTLRKLLVAIPSNTGRQSLPSDFSISLMNSLMDFMRKRQDVEISVKQFGGLRIDSVRLQMVTYSCDNEFDAIIMIDDDMLIPVDGIRKLVEDYESGKRIVSALYYSKDYPFNPYLSEDKIWQNEFEKDRIYTVKQLGTGFIIIDTKVFSELPQPIFLLRMDQWGRITATEDCYFAHRCNDANIEMYVDTSIYCGHMKTVAFPQLFEHPYIHHKMESPFVEGQPTGNIKKKKTEPFQTMPDFVLCKEAMPDTYWQDGCDICKHENIVAMPKNQGNPQLYKCLDCGYIGTGLINTQPITIQRSNEEHLQDINLMHVSEEKL